MEEKQKMSGQEALLTKVNEAKARLTHPIAFNILNSALKEELPESTGLTYRLELGKCTWEYLTCEKLQSDFSPAAYMAMRKILRQHMLWVLEHCGRNEAQADQANFYMALTSADSTEGKSYLARISKNGDRKLLADCRALEEMMDAHDAACGTVIG